MSVQNFQKPQLNSTCTHPAPHPKHLTADRSLQEQQNQQQQYKRSTTQCQDTARSKIC